LINFAVIWPGGASTNWPTVTLMICVSGMISRVNSKPHHTAKAFGYTRAAATQVSTQAVKAKLVSRGWVVTAMAVTIKNTTAHCAP
jgi:uncharacterized protein affecting Mg2+/Co2+ transport